MEDIRNVLLKLLEFKTIGSNTKEFDKLFNYVKDICNDKLFIKEYIFNNKKCMVISNYDGYSFDVIFCTHIDVVESDSYEIVEDNDNLYGRGTIDMKGSVSVCLNVMNNLNTSKKVALFITSDEEIDGNCVKELLEKYTGSFAIVPDGGSNFDLIVEEKGALQLKVLAEGVSAHASQPFNGDNAIVKVMDVYNDLISKYPLPTSSDDYVTTVNLSKIEGGNATNCVPDYAVCYFDIRRVSKDSVSDILDIIKKHDVKYEILLDGDVFKTDLNNNFVKKYIESSEKVLNKKINKAGCESTSDAIYFYLKNIPTVIMNPVGYYPHNPKEYVNKKSLLDLYNIYMEFINNL